MCLRLLLVIAAWVLGAWGTGSCPELSSACASLTLSEMCEGTCLTELVDLFMHETCHSSMEAAFASLKECPGNHSHTPCTRPPHKPTPVPCAHQWTTYRRIYSTHAPPVAVPTHFRWNLRISLPSLMEGAVQTA